MSVLSPEEKVIEVENLSKQFRQLRAVQSLNINVYRGDVFGFLGPNGAGKSTTIRMLLSLIRPDNGRIRIFGFPLQEKRIQILRNVGAIVEKPDFYTYLTAYKNLEILGRLSHADTSKKKIFEVLDLVGLKDRAFSRVKTYSHGMKQRLGIAQALLHDPDLIILDEPTTGLDPQGMKEIRDLIIHLSKDRKKTILLSSHILYEVELVANRMIIINKGKTVVEGYVRELLNTNIIKVTVEVSDLTKASELIMNSRWKQVLDCSENGKLIFQMQQDDIPVLNRFLIESGIEVSALIPTRSLEEYFLNLTSKEENVDNRSN